MKLVSIFLPLSTYTTIICVLTTIMNLHVKRIYQAAIDTSLAAESNFYVHNATYEKVEKYKMERGLLFLGIPVALTHGIYSRKYQHIVLPSFHSNVWNLFNENDQKMPMQTLFRLAIHMSNAYEYIHSCKLVHGNLSGSHIMIDESGMPYLIDYQLAIPYAIGTYEENSEKYHYGTPEYCSYDAHLVNIYFNSYDII